MKSRLGLNLNCVDCEKYTHWIEILIRDEWNQPFNNVTGFIVDATGRATKITLGSKPIFLDTLAAGPVKLYLEMNEPQIWFKEAQAIEHKPNNDNPNLVKDFALAYVGKSAPIYLEATSGDFNTDHGNAIFVHDDGKPEYTPVELPERHQAGKADDLHFVTDKTYVVKVRAFNLLSLRIGMFFDGTRNNTYSSLWGHAQLEDYYPLWKVHRDASLKSHYTASTPVSAILANPIDAKDLDDKSREWPNQYSLVHSLICDDGKHEHINGSAMGELTNVQKMYDFYYEDEFIQDTDIFVHKEYITGIGTGNEVLFKPAKESLPGQGLGIGDYGVEQKVLDGIDQLCASMTGTNPHRKKNDFNIMLTELLDSQKFDGLRSIKFDVFGFSRGSASARHFINQVLLDADTNVFIPKFTEACNKINLPLSPGFDWTNNDNCMIGFAGIFDTVAAVSEIIDLNTPSFDVLPNDRNGDVMLWLDPERIQKAYHFTAHPEFEYRAFFGLNKFNKGGPLEEIALFGCHSDIGGGYYSSQSLAQKDYILPLLEKQKIIETYSENKTVINNTIKNYTDREVRQGWNKEDLEIKIEAKNFSRRGGYMGSIYMNRITSGDLSRIYLRLAYGLAHYNEVPLHDYWNKDINVDLGLNNPRAIYPIQRYISLPSNLAIFGNNVLKEAMKGNIYSKLLSKDFKQALLKHSMIHHSSDAGIANIPSRNDELNRYYRKEYDCEKN
ncbi:TPA: phospholipase effector Tle1 domain-containing protein [Photobacterium damselae]